MIRSRHPRRDLKVLYPFVLAKKQSLCLKILFKGTVMQIEKGPINIRLRVFKVS